MKKSGSLHGDNSEPVFIGNGDNDVPVASASRMAKHDDLKEWQMHGTPEDDNVDMPTSNTTDLANCKYPT